MKLFISILIFALLSISTITAKESTWPAWRGAERTGEVTGPKWPKNLENLNALWTVPLGKSYSSPIVAEDRVFVFETTEETHATVRALKRSDGSEIWSKSWESSIKVPFFAEANGSWVKSTPAWDGKTLFVGDAREVLYAFDGETGEERWSVDFPTTYATAVPPFGFASSPLIVDDMLYIQAANSIIKMEAATGKVLWRGLADGDGGGDMSAQSAFSSPILTTVAGKEQLVVLTRRELAGVNPETGETLWSKPLPNFRGCLIVTPTVYGDGIFTSSFRNGSYYIGLNNNDGQMSAEQIWDHKVNTYMSSPVVIGDYAYLHLTNSRMACIDLKSGETTWTTSEKFGKYSSMVWQDDRILMLSETGTLHLMEANPQAFTSVATAQVADGNTWAYLGISGNELYVRALEKLTVYEWK